MIIADITLNNTGVSQLQIHTDGVVTGGSPAGHDVSFARSQLLYAIAHGTTWPGIASVNILGALTALSNEMDNVTAAGVLNYLGSSLTTPTGAWADASTLASQLTLGGAVSNLVGVLGGTTGAAKIGFIPVAPLTSVTVAAAINRSRRASRHRPRPPETHSSEVRHSRGRRSTSPPVRRRPGFRASSIRRRAPTL